MLRRACREGSASGLEAEVEVLGLTHAELGGLVAREWDLPDSIVEPIAQHHAPTAVLDEVWRRDAATVFLADMVAKLALDGVERTWFVAGEVRAAMDLIGLQRDALRPLCARVFERYRSDIEAHAAA
jgi:hypothetical protein